MIIFDSNNSKNKWSGKGFSFEKEGLVAFKNANFKHKVPLKRGEYKFRIFAKNRTGSGPLFIKIITERNIVLFSQKLTFSKSWSEMSFDFEMKKNYGSGFLVIYREELSYGSVDLGRVILETKAPISISANKVRKRAPINRKVGSKKKVNANISIQPEKPNTKKKIGFIVPYGIYGGAEVYLETLINNLDPDIFNIHIICLKKNPISKMVSNPSAITKVVSNDDNFINYVKNEKFELLVYYNSTRVYNLCIKARQSISNTLKLVEIYHSDFKWGDSLSSHRKRDNIDLMFTVAPKLAEDIKGVKCRKLLRVPLDIDKFSIRDVDNLTDAKLNLPNSNRVIGVVSRLSAEKNIDYVLDIADIGKEYNFVLFGTGPLEKHIRHRISSENLKNVFLAGFKKDIFRYYGLFDAFLLTSKMEGTPISILEAMASGVPVFTSNVGQISSIVQDENTGFFLNGDPRKDLDKINKNIFRDDIIINARKYIEENHNQIEISNLFVDSIIDSQGNYIKDNKIRKLIGEYI